MRKFTLILITLTALVCQSLYTYAQTKKQEVKVTAKEKPRLSPEQAIDSLTKIIDRPNINKAQLAPFYFLRAEIYRSINQLNKAYQDYNSCIAINSSYKNAVWNRGITSEALNNFQSAEADYRQAITMVPRTDSVNRAILYCNIANIKLKLQKPDSSLYYDSVALNYVSDYSRAFFVRGVAHITLKDYPGAIQDITQAILLNKNYSNIKQLSFWYANLGDAERLNKQYKEAINKYSYSLKLNPDNPIAYWNRAAAYHQHKDYELAANDYSKAMTYYAGQNTQLSKLYDDRATNELGQNLLKQAIKDDSTAIALDPNDRIAYFNLADAYTQNADYQKSIDMFKATLNFQKENKKLNSILYYQIANNEYFLNQFDKVIVDCTTAITLNPENSSAYFYRAKVYLKKLNKADLASSDFNKVILLDTSHKSVSYVFSLFYIGKGDAATEILQHEVLNTTDELILLSDYYNLACLYSMMNKPDDANNYLKMAIEKGYSKKYAAADEDLDNIRNTADYRSIIIDSK